MFAYLEILRPINGLMSILALIISAMIVGFPLSLELLIAFLIVFLVSSGGMIINDYFDYAIDKINRPKRPIPSKRISAKNALAYAIILLLIANVLSLNLNLYALVLVVLNTILVVVYSWKLKKTILIGNLCVSWLTASIFLLGSLLRGYLSIAILILFSIVFSASVGREIAKSIEDVKGDKKLKLKTLPIIFGNNFAAFIAIIFIFFAISFTPLPYAFGLMGINYVLLIVITDLIFAISCFTILISPSRSQRFMKIGMLIGLLAFLVGTF